MRSVILIISLIAILVAFPDNARGHFTLVEPPSAMAFDDGGKGAPPCGEGESSNIVTKVRGGHPLPIRLIETVIHPGHYRVALSVNSRAELPPDPDVKASGGLSVSAAIQNPPGRPVLADGLFVHTQALPGVEWQTAIMLPNINCAKCTLQVIEFMAEHEPNPGGGYFYHHCADLQIEADSNSGPLDSEWTLPVGVYINPPRVHLKPNTVQQFSASVIGLGNNKAVRWTAAGGSISSAGLYTAPSLPGDYLVTATSVADPSKSDTVRASINPLNEELYFAQFATGGQPGSAIVSELTLVPLAGATTATIEINDDLGNPLSVNLNGVAVPGRTNILIPANGILTLTTDGVGVTQTGSLKVSSDLKLAGALLFSGTLGLSGVVDSKALKKFAAPIKAGSGVNTGIALMGLGEDQSVQFELRNAQGGLVSKTSVRLSAKGHIAKFIDQFAWDGSVDFSRFTGTLVATGSSDMAATVLLVTPAGSTALPAGEIP